MISLVVVMIIERGERKRRRGEIDVLGCNRFRVSSAAKF
jgi:hypothetical protein